MDLKRAALCLAVSGLLGAASAHAAGPTSPLLLTSDPADGTSFKKAPGSVTLDFSQPLDPHYSRMEIYDECGKRVDGGMLTVNVNEMSVAVKKARTKGTYEVYYAANAEPKGATGETSGYLHFDVKKGKACRKR